MAVTSMPGRSVVRLYPNLANWLTLLCSIAQVVTFPLLSFTSKKIAMCGLRHSTSFTVPFNATSFLAYVAPRPAEVEGDQPRVAVSLGVAPPGLVALLQVLQFDLQYCRLQAIQTAVVTNDVMVVF